MNVPTRPKAELEALGDPAQMRRVIRSGAYDGRTLALALEFVQANLAVVPADYASDFLRYCQRNPRPCPLLEVIEDGEVEPRIFAPGADIRTDIAKYRVYEHGNMVAEVNDISEFWRDDLVSFLLGCSFSFIEKSSNVSMFITNIPTTEAGQFSGPMVVSMRPVHRDKIVRAVQVTSRFPAVHGAPVHVGDPEAIGIKDVTQPDLGDAVEFKENEVPVFWACGVTPQAVAMNSKPPLMITHSPGYMFITDEMDEDLAVL